MIVTQLRYLRYQLLVAPGPDERQHALDDEHECNGREDLLPVHAAGLSTAVRLVEIPEEIVVGIENQ